MSVEFTESTQRSSPVTVSLIENQWTGTLSIPPSGLYTIRSDSKELHGFYDVSDCTPDGVLQLDLKEGISLRFDQNRTLIGVWGGVRTIWNILKTRSNFQGFRQAVAVGTLKTIHPAYLYLKDSSAKLVVFIPIDRNTGKAEKILSPNPYIVHVRGRADPFEFRNGDILQPVIGNNIRISQTDRKLFRADSLKSIVVNGRSFDIIGRTLATNGLIFTIDGSFS